MTLEEVRKLVHTTPFLPFTICLADGSTIRVPHTDFIAIPANGRTVVIYREGERAHTLIDLLLVTKLEIEDSARSAS